MAKPSRQVAQTTAEAWRAARDRHRGACPPGCRGSPSPSIPPSGSRRRSRSANPALPGPAAPRLARAALADLQVGDAASPSQSKMARTSRAATPVFAARLPRRALSQHLEVGERYGRPGTGAVPSISPHGRPLIWRRACRNEGIDRPRSRQNRQKCCSASCRAHRRPSRRTSPPSTCSAAASTAPQATRASEPPMLIRRTPSSASSATLHSGAHHEDVERLGRHRLDHRLDVLPPAPARPARRNSQPPPRRRRRFVDGLAHRARAGCSGAPRCAPRGSRPGPTGRWSSGRP